eukprot:2032868-Amphidinium_carterae.1
MFLRVAVDEASIATKRPPCWNSTSEKCMLQRLHKNWNSTSEECMLHELHKNFKQTLVKTNLLGRSTGRVSSENTVMRWKNRR